MSESGKEQKGCFFLEQGKLNLVLCTLVSQQGKDQDIRVFPSFVKRFDIFSLTSLSLLASSSTKRKIELK